MAIIDLHVHTNCSDGELTPYEVIDEAVRNNVKYLSITDHDTVDAYSDNLYSYARDKGINLINGVEISTKNGATGIHVLGYNIDIYNKELKNKLFKLRNNRHDYLFKVAQALEYLGYKINVLELDKIDAVTKAHISKDVIGNEDNHKLLLDFFGHIPTYGEFIETIMNEGCPAYVKKESITPKEAANLIRTAGGIVILAHPVAYFYEDNLDESDIDGIIKNMKPDGIETCYVYIDKNGIKHNDIEKWRKFAINRELKETIGSDFHKKDNIYPEIGLFNEDIILDERYINSIIDFINKK